LKESEEVKEAYRRIEEDDFTEPLKKSNMTETALIGMLNEETDAYFEHEGILKICRTVKGINEFFSSINEKLPLEVRVVELDLVEPLNFTQS